MLSDMSNFQPEVRHAKNWEDMIHCAGFFLTLFIFLKCVCLVERCSKLYLLCLIGHVAFSLWVLNRFADLGVCRLPTALNQII